MFILYINIISYKLYKQKSLEEILNQLLTFHTAPYFPEDISDIQIK
jgi:hypothetical protein